MDNVIEAARNLGRVLQSDGRYIKFATALAQNDEDPVLQEIIAKFTEKREVLSALAKDGGDEQAITALNEEVHTLYNEIFQNETMARFNTAREELELLMAFVNQIISGSQDGHDPDKIEYQAPGGCGGSCGGCSSGCGS